jgi:FkbM family methyltransferase
MTMPDSHGPPISSAVVKLIQLGRRLLPASLRLRIRALQFQWLDLRWTLPSGVSVRIANYPEWVVYNEIFTSGEYDAAISRALDSAPDATSLHIVDLGTNVGFFTLRVVDWLRQRRTERKGLKITAVEGNRRLIEEFRSRVMVENALSASVRLVHGLIGERAGTATLYGPGAHTQNSLFRRTAPSKVQVDYVDLVPLFASDPQIDLLKCDIEGAELLFIQNYPDLLWKVRVAIFELHDDLCDTQQCRRLLSEYGFTQQTVLRQHGPCSIYCVWR